MRRPAGRIPAVAEGLNMTDDTVQNSTGPAGGTAGASSGRVPARVQRVQRGAATVAAVELRDFSDTAESEHLARLEADQELLLRLSLEGFGGRTWEELSRALAEYGFAVMRAWIATGVVRVKC